MGVGKSACDGGGAASAQRDAVLSVLGVRTTESVHDGGITDSSQRDLPVVGVGVSDGVTACVVLGVCFVKNIVILCEHVNERTIFFCVS